MPSTNRAAGRASARAVLVAFLLLALALGFPPATANPPTTSSPGDKPPSSPATSTSSTSTTLAAPPAAPGASATDPSSPTSEKPPTTAKPSTDPPAGPPVTTTTAPGAPVTSTPPQASTSVPASTTTTTGKTTTTTTTTSTPSTTTTLPRAVPPPATPGTVTLPVGQLAAGQPVSPGTASAVSSVTSTAATHGTVSLDGTDVTYTADPGYYGPVSFDYLICDEAVPIAATDGTCSSRTVQMNVTPDGAVVDELRPSPVDPTVATSLYASTGFLYTGSDPVQRDVAPGTIERRRAAVIRGTVRDAGGRPLEGVRVAIAGHPEFGYTSTRASGTFDLAVNGGGTLLVTYDRDGWSAAQRPVDAGWGEYAWAPTVTLTSGEGAHSSADPALRLIAGTAGAAGAGAPPGKAGSGRPMILVPAAGKTRAAGADGNSVQALALQVAEYAPDDGSHASLPGLPAGDAGPAYTFDTWASGQPRRAAGQVGLDPSVAYYTEDPTGRRVGEVLPLRSYDWTQAAWVPETATGMALAILAVDGGSARIDADGDGDSDARDASLLTGIGVTDTELRQLASLYRPGTTVLRLSLPHLGTWAWWTDVSAGPGANDAAPGPARSGPVAGAPAPAPAPEKRDVAGTPFALVASPSSSAGRTLSVPVTGPDPVAGLNAVEVVISVAGSRHVARLDPSPSQTYEFVWDGLDAYGRAVQGTFPARVEVVYSIGPSRLTRSAGTVALHAMDSAGQGLGGWTLDAHQVLDPEQNRLYAAGAAERVSRTDELRREWPSAVGARVDDIAAGADGSIYTAEANRVRRVGPDGTVSVLAGSDRWGFAGDGGPATSAAFRGARALALGPGRSVYVLDRGNGRVRRIGADGVITTVAGGGRGVPATGGRATDAILDNPRDLAVGTDGTLYIAGDDGRVLRVGSDGWLEPLAVTGHALAPVPAADGGGVLVADETAGRIAKVASDGSIEVTIDSGRVGALAAAPGGDLFVVADDGLRRIDAAGTSVAVATAPAVTAPDDSAPDSLALSGAAAPGVDTAAVPAQLRSVAVGPDGAVHIATSAGMFGWGASRQERDGSGDLRVPSASGSEIFAFDPAGRHRRTLDAATGAVKVEFGYDSSGRLSDIDIAGAGRARVERDPRGSATAIVAPGGERTEFAPKVVRLAASDPVLGIPAAVLRAYQDAAAGARSRYDCDIRWTVLAAIGKTESGHGTYGGARVNARGDIVPHIIGIPLDGRIGTERITDTDGGRFDNDTVFDRAVGPMQFIPSTWRSIGVDADGDGVADPHNIFDAALSAARYLCRAAPPGNLSNRDQLAKAVFSYNHSSAYVAHVLADADFYDGFNGMLSPVGGLVAGGFALPVDRAFVDRNPGALDQPHHDYPAIDLAVPIGSRVFAAAGGRVVSVSSDGRCGRGVVIDAGDGYRYTYCHADRVMVASGDQVAAGQVVMLSGNTGNSTGPHLHLQIARPDGTLVCPQSLMKAWYSGLALGPGAAATRGCIS